jgi:regulatory protein
MLGRRELSEAQVRQRLERRGHLPSDVDDALARLKAERALDDERVAGAIARTQTSIKGRGRGRVLQELLRAGIAAAHARQAVEETFRDLNDDTLLAAALGRRLKGGRTIADDAEFRRLYRYLVGQGFEPNRVLTLLSRHRIKS